MKRTTNLIKWGCIIGLGSAGVLMLVAASAAGYLNNYPEYHFTGRIQSEHVKYVRFYERPWKARSVLEVGKLDGTTVEYVALELPEHELTLDEVIVSTGGSLLIQGQETKFSAKSQHPDIAGLVETAKADFQRYLSEIIKAKTDLYNQTAQK